MAETYQYSLRFAIDPFNWNEERAKKLIKFCQEARIDNVVFFINPEELNQGHLTIEQVRTHWLPTVAKVSKQLAEMDITTSLNP